MNPANRFLKNEREIYVDDLATEEERMDALRYNAKTKFIEVFPKTILNKVESPDLLSVEHESLSRLRAWLCLLLCTKHT